MSDKPADRQAVTHVVTERVFHCCTDCDIPGDCAARDECALGVPRSLRMLDDDERPLAGAPGEA